MEKFFTLDTMLTPKLITFIYWLLLCVAVSGGIGMMLSGQSFFLSLVSIVVGVLGARISCELLIVIFKIHENIKRIADKE